MCLDPNTQNFVEWSDHKSICNDGKLIDKSKWYVDYSDSKSFHNWMTDQEMYCESNFMIGLFGSVFFLGFAMTGIMLKQADKFGRKKVLTFGLIMQTICWYLLYFSDNQYAHYVILFLTGLIISKNYICYIMATEFVPKRLQMLMGWIWLTSDTFIPVMTSSIYYLAGGKDWKTIMIVPLVVSPITIIVSFFMLESPRYLYSREQFGELRENIEKIARINGVEVNIRSVSFSKEIKLKDDIRRTLSVETDKNKDEAIKEVEHEHEFTISKELKNKITLINLIVTVSWFTMVSFNFYMVGFYMKYIGGNIFLNVMLSTCSENLGNFAALIIQKKLGTRKSFMVSFFGSMLFALPLIFFTQEWIIALCVFSSKFWTESAFMLAYYVNSEMFPPLFVPFSFSIWALFAKTITIMAPQVAELPKPIPIIVFWILGGISTFSTMFLRKPKGENNEESE